jgi:hypothetical protein
MHFIQDSFRFGVNIIVMISPHFGAWESPSALGEGGKEFIL